MQPQRQQRTYDGRSLAATPNTTDRLANTNNHSQRLETVQSLDTAAQPAAAIYLGQSRNTQSQLEPQIAPTTWPDRDEQRIMEPGFSLLQLDTNSRHELHA